MRDQDEGDLIERAQRRDPAALEAIVQAHKDAVFRFARSLSRTETEAEDVFQETFVTAVKHLDQYRGEGSLRAWLLTTARRVAIRLHRRRAGEPTSFEPLDELGARAGWGMTGDDFEARIADRDVIRHGFEQLSDEDREIIVLRDIEGMSSVETARVLDIGLPATKSRLHRARLRLVAALRKGDEDGARS